jgi:hypothetical protein
MRLAASFMIRLYDATLRTSTAQRTVQKIQSSLVALRHDSKETHGTMIFRWL